MDNDVINPLPIPPEVPINQENEAIGNLQNQDDQQHSSAMQNFNQPRQSNPRFEKYYQKRTNLIHNEELNKHDTYIKVTVSTSPILDPSSKKYFINQKGLIGSPKTADSEDIIIGRSHTAYVNPNDIEFTNDKKVSRIHCKLICNDYFREEPILKLIYILALYSIRTQSNFPLPQRARFIICQFLDKPRHVFVQDLGSITGTQVSIQKDMPYIMKHNQMCCFGSNTRFIVQFCQSFNEEGIEIDDHFFLLLKTLNLFKHFKHEIYFSDKQVLEKFWIIYQQQFDILDSQNKFKNYIEIYDKLKEYKVSFISIKFNMQQQNINHSLFSHIFIHLENQDSNEIQIGRAHENQIRIQCNTISRKQCRFQYLKSLNSWVIFDGTKNQNSQNGTWIQLQTIEQMKKREESDLIEIKSKQVIKVSNVYLKIEMIKENDINEATTK